MAGRAAGVAMHGRERKPPSMVSPIFRCHAGLVLWAAPLMVEGEHVATIICGQVLMWEPEDFFWEEIEEYTRPLDLIPGV